jgi:hypothetical protein
MLTPGLFLLVAQYARVATNVDALSTVPKWVMRTGTHSWQFQGSW